MIVKVGTQLDFEGFEVSDEPGFYIIEDTEGYLSPSWTTKIYCVHDGKYCLLSSFPFKTKVVEELDLPNTGDEIIDGVVILSRTPL